MSKIKSLRFSPSVAVPLAVIASLLFVWSIDHTVAVRNVFIALSLLLLIPVWSAFPGLLRDPDGGRPWRWVLALTAWLIFQAALISPEPAWAFGELRGQWVKALICLVIGFGTVIASRRQGVGRETICLVIAGALGFQCLLHALDSLWLWAQSGHPPFQIARLTGSKEKISYVNNLFMAMLAAELVVRINGGLRLLPIRWPLLAGAIGVAYFNSWVIGARNGVLGAMALTFSATLLILIAQRHRLGPRRLLVVGTAVLLGLGTLGFLSFKSDPRWQSMVQDMEIGWQTDRYKSWLDLERYPLPVRADGETVSHSNYMRLAWAKEGALIALEHPLGIGYGRTAFGHALVKRYPDEHPQPGAHSHSGMVDWAIATGVPGVALWLAFLGVGFVAGLRGYFQRQDPASLMLALVISGFFARSLVDSNLRDHMLEQFMFLYGAFYTLALPMASRLFLRQKADSAANVTA
ncbi:MAG TPA: O-antigen ligase family protein [Azospira sp.]|nr:O-antigen ligase family protein [Azospira sp.]